MQVLFWAHEKDFDVKGREFEEQKADENETVILEVFDNNKNPNANERNSGKNVPPLRLLGHFPFGPISTKVNIGELAKEPRACNINTFECKHGFWSGI